MNYGPKIKMGGRTWNTFSGRADDFGEYTAPKGWQVAEVLSFKHVGGNDHVLSVVLVPAAESEAALRAVADAAFLFVEESGTVPEKGRKYNDLRKALKALREVS